MCTYVCTVFVSMQKRMYMCVYVHPPSISSGTTTMFSVPHSRGQNPAIHSAGGMSFKSGDWGQSISWAQGTLCGPQGNWTMVSPSLPSGEREIWEV
jgi:hypothetical protein